VIIGGVVAHGVFVVGKRNPANLDVEKHVR
jgi:hypothetical protein